MDQQIQDDEICLIPIKKKPKVQVLHKTNLNIKSQPNLKKPINKSNPKRMDLKIQASLLDSLKFTENIQPDVTKSCLNNDFTQWEHQNFVFKLSQSSQNQKVECDEKLIQYFSDFNQKWKIYPYKHFVDLKPETDHIITVQPLRDSQKQNKKGQNQIKMIPLKQNQKLIDINIKLELQ